MYVQNTYFDNTSFSEKLVVFTKMVWLKGGDFEVITTPKTGYDCSVRESYKSYVYFKTRKGLQRESKLFMEAMKVPIKCFSTSKVFILQKNCEENAFLNKAGSFTPATLLKKHPLQLFFKDFDRRF